MIWEILDDYDALSKRAASLLLDAIRATPRPVLGLPAGRTPEGMYERVVAAARSDSVSFSAVTTFNLDEYAGVARDHPGSYYAYMKRHLFDRVDLDPSRTNVPDGAPVPRLGEPASDALAAECARYEAAIKNAGSLGLTFLGLGTNGHIGFNEPGTPFDSRTRVVELAASTRMANSALFPAGKVPRLAITIGIATMLESSAIVLLASGEAKREAVARLRGNAADESFPASALWRHPNVRVLVDRSAK
ncbi:MAG TPA: glucosamine-6-phosphate deaminase [Thermoanaerobaculia bacterium]|nr:glucosamine-6-phosphate deaminase [Thermoanaerobaculia bacterium]